VFFERTVLPPRVRDHQSQAYRVLPWKFKGEALGNSMPAKPTEYERI